MLEQPILQTIRYELLPIVAGDQPFIYEGLGDPKVAEFYAVSYNSLEATASQMEFYARVWREQTGCYWKIVEKKTGEAKGVVGMSSYNQAFEKAELGAWLLPKYWRQGIMKEAMPAMFDWLFQKWRLHRLEGVVETGNAASSALVKSLGFQFEGILRDAELKNGRRISLEMYSLLKPEWLHRQGASTS